MVRHFEGIQRSIGHTSGIAVCFPHIPRWHTGKAMEEADALETTRSMLPEIG